MDANDRELFDRSIVAVVERDSGSALDRKLDDLGWYDALSVEPHVAVSTLFSALGSSARHSSALSSVLAQALGTPLGVPVVLSRPSGSSPPGLLNGEFVSVDGLAASDFGDQRTVVVVADGQSGPRAVAIATGQLNAEPVGGLDPDQGLLRLTGRVGIDDNIGSVDWAGAVRLARLAIGHELVGVSRHMLELARDHAVGRVQFDVPISSFQAVRHRLAETLVAVEVAEAALDVAWLDKAPHHAAIAKALAGRGARTAARHCQQVLAGIGFTLEHPFHRYLRRGLVLDELFGSARTLSRDIGAEVLRSGRLPSEIAL